MPLPATFTNHPPVLPVLVQQVLPAGGWLIVTNTASDADLPAQLLTYGLLSAPAGAAIDAQGVITWLSATVPEPTTNAFVTVVSDGYAAATNRFEVVVLPPVVVAQNTAPQLFVPADRTLNELDFYGNHLTGWDAEDGTNGLAFSLVDGPTGLSVTPDGAVAWTPTEAQGGSVNVVTVRVTDNGTPALSVTNQFTVSVNEVNSAPVLTLPTDVTVLAQTIYTAKAMATDADVPTNGLTYGLVSGPAGLTVAADGQIAWTPADNQAGTNYPITVQVTDDGRPALSATNHYIITVLRAATDLVLLDNLDAQQEADFTYPDGATNVWAAQGFWSGSAVQLTRLSLNLHRLNVAGGSFFVRLHEAASAGVPGAALATLAAGQSIGTLTNEDAGRWEVSGLAVGINTNTEYFVVVGQENKTASGLLWGYSNESLTNSSFNQTYDAGQTWALADYNYPQRLRVEGSTVPLPATFTNHPPVLNLPLATTVDGLRRYVAQATATDPDGVANTFTFALLSGPQGMTVNPSNGQITWTPTITQSPSTNWVTIMVADDGVPSLCKTNSYQIIVRSVSLNYDLVDTSKASPMADLCYSLGASQLLGAQSFNSGQSIRLTEVEINLHRMNSCEGNYFVKLYDSAAPGIPGQIVAGGLLAQHEPVSMLGLDDESKLILANLSIPLVTNRDYFIVVGLEETSANGLLWSYTSSTTDEESFFNSSIDGGVTWSDPDILYPQRMRITASAFAAESTNLPPQLTLPANQYLNPQCAYLGQITAFDPDGDIAKIHLNLLRAPQGLLLLDNGGIAWTPTAEQAGTTNIVEIVAFDEGSPSASTTNFFCIVVKSINKSPTILDTRALPNLADFVFPNFDDTTMAAQSFNSGSNNVMNRIELNLHRLNTAQGTFSVMLCDSAAPGIPGKMIFGGLLSTNQAISGLETTDEGMWKLDKLNVPLTCNTEYFVVVRQDDPKAMGLLWGYGCDETTASAFNQSYSAGTNWGTPDYSFPQRMLVEGAIQTASVVLERPVLHLTVNPDGSANLSWNSVPGKRYRVYYTDYLERGAWYNLHGDIKAINTTISITQSMDQRYRCFRVEVLP